MDPLEPGTVVWDAVERPADDAERAHSMAARLLLRAGISLAVVGCFMSWMSILILDVAGTRTETGKAFLALALGTGFLVLVALARPAERGWLVAVTVAAAVMTLAAAEELRSIVNIENEPFPVPVPAAAEGSVREVLEAVQPGHGIYAVLAGWLATLAGAVKGLVDTRSR